VRSVVIVGASLAGCRAAEALREEGFDGRVVLIGDEAHPPYDRPPLSKQVLAGTWDTDRLELPAVGADLDLDWRLGTRATGLDLSARKVVLAGGEEVPFDGLVIATGATPRLVPVAEGMAGIHVLRSLDDCLALRAELDRTPSRVVVVGAGFIGAEVAATCRERGLDVTMIEALPAPLARVLGEVIGTTFTELHRAHGVDVRTGVGVTSIDGGGRVERVHLDDGSVVEADVVVVGVGVRPVTDWLEGSGLTLEDGVLCDATCLAAPGVVAAGDVARWPNPIFGQVMRVEHWDNALDQGAHAARTLLAGEAGGTPYASVPWFWSDQYDRKLQLAGRPGPGDEMRIVDGSLEERRFVGLFGRDGKVVAAFGMNRPAPIMRYRARIGAGLDWDTALAEAGDAG
jgi:3-phenylpropionate/trans-cinnamate dioxygenase ferredoxin reductase subunit